LTLTLRPYGAVGLLEPSPGNHAAAARVGSQARRPSSSGMRWRSTRSGTWPA